MKKNIKKIFLFVAVVVTALVCFAVSASALNATGQCGDNVYWEYNITTDELVISGTGPMTDYENYYSSPFYSNNIKSVVINDGVTTIGDYAFFDCGSLTEVTIPDSVTIIGEEAFYFCDSLTNVTFGNSVTTIGDWAFGYCCSLTEVTIGDSVTTIGDWAFGYCCSLTEVIIGDSVTTIGDRAFYECDSLTEVTIPDSVTTIGYAAFSDCDSLTEVTIGDSVTTIGDYAFSDCDSLKSITIGNSVTTIGNSVTTIGNSAFFSCDSLTEVVIGDSVTTIGDDAFYWCDSLTKVTIPDSVTTIGDSAFCYCDSLTTIAVDENNRYFSNDEYGVLFNKDKTTLIQYPIGNQRTAYAIPDSVTTIGDLAFSDCDSLTKVTIGDSVKTIGDFAFRWCDSLTEVTIPDSVTTIGSGAFYHCDSLTEVTIGNSVTSIGGSAFSSCNSLTSVTIGNSVTTIGDEAFRYCYSLTEDTIPDSVTSIGHFAFSSCNSLTSITIPDSVTTIGSGAFYHCYSLTEVTIGNSVTTIGGSAFYSCDSLTEVTIGDSVTTIGNSAFYECDSLTEVTIGDSVTTIGDYAFSSCDSLTDVYYGGTQEQWKKIKIGSYNGDLTGANIHYNKSGKPIESTYSVEFNGAVSKYPDFNRLMSSFCALPGLKNTTVVDADKMLCDICNCMTPQGICFAGDYVLVSAYCSVETYKDNLTSKILNGDNYDKLSAEKNHSTHKSVIYVINRNKKTLLTTLTLPDKNHVGGLAFDGSNVWIAKSSDKKVSAISLSTIKSAVNSGDEGVAVNYEKTFSCGHTASFVEYFDNKLWVGVFNEEESSNMYGFSFNSGKENVSGLTEVASVAIPAKANGAAFYSNGTKTALIVNSSYGRKNDSKIYMYDVKSALNRKNITTNLINTYTFPSLAEEVVVEGDKLYMIFESAATTYCNVDGNKASAVVDRICEGNAEGFFGLHNKTTKNITATQSTSTITLNWSAVDGATGYRVYQYSPSKGKYVVIASIKGKTTYTKSKNLKAGSQYKFKIKPYVKLSDGTVIWGDASSAFTTATKPLAPTKVTATTTKSTITLNWSKSAGATGYRVYQYSPSKGKYVVISSVKGVTSYKKSKNLKAGTTYKFKIKPYVKLADGTVIWGSASSAFAFKTKTK